MKHRMKLCPDCKNKKIRTYSNRCRQCFGIWRTKNFRHSEKTKRKISLAKKQPKKIRFCKICNKKIGNDGKTGLCRSHSRITDITEKIINGITIIKLAGKNKAGLAKWRCICHCGKEFVAIGSKIRLGRVKSCGCSHIEHARELGKRQKGENNPVWIKDRTKLSLYIRKNGKWNWCRNKSGSWQWFSKQYKLEKKLACELTGYKAEKFSEVECHHITPVSHDSELCFCYDNIILVKRSIHKKFHKIYGRKAPEEDWYKFINNEHFSLRAA